MSIAGLHSIKPTNCTQPWSKCSWPTHSFGTRSKWKSWQYGTHVIKKTWGSYADSTSMSTCYSANQQELPILLTKAFHCCSTTLVQTLLKGSNCTEIKSKTSEVFTYGILLQQLISGYWWTIYLIFFIRMWFHLYLLILSFGCKHTIK